MKAHQGLTANQRRAMEQEINRQLAKNMEKLERDISACVLYSMRQKYGFGKIRLLDFHKTFRKNLDLLIKRYELNEEDKAWLCKVKLQEIGIDIDKLEIENHIFTANVTERNKQKGYET